MVAPTRKSSRGFENGVSDISQELKEEGSENLCVVCGSNKSPKDEGLSRMRQERRIALTKSAEYFERGEITDRLKIIDKKIAAGEKVHYEYHKSCLVKIEYQYKRIHSKNQIEEASSDPPATPVTTPKKKKKAPKYMLKILMGIVFLIVVMFITKQYIGVEKILKNFDEIFQWCLLICNKTLEWSDKRLNTSAHHAIL